MSLLFALLLGAMIHSQASGAGRAAFAPDSAIVIGAGMSGLSAAADLCARGYQVTVVEARDRLGGRTSTVTLPVSGFRVEAGAGWLHGCRDNALSDLADANALPTRIGDDESGASWTVSPAAGASGVARSALVAAADDEAWTACAEDFAEHYDETSDDREDDETLQSVFDAWASARGLRGLARAGCYAVARSDSADLEYGATMAQLSAAWFSEGEEMRGAERIVDPAAGGYTALVNLLRDRIANSASRCALQTASQVARIVLDSPQGGVRVDLANGRSLAAAFVVCTLPLGVLKGQAVAFSPPLPARKQAAVRRLGVGLLDKVVLVYSRQFWAKLSGGDEGWLQLVFPDQPPPGSWAADGTALEFWNGAKFGLSAGSGAGHAAVALLLGASTAEAWERQPDSVLVARADALFRSLWPSSAAGGAAGAAPRLVESLVTRWRSDRFANGSYSYLPPGARPADRRELCAAQADKLFWAGEHCSINHPATAHGAYESGLAAARAAAAARPRAVAAMSAEAAAALRPRPADGAAGQPSAVRALLPCALMAFAVAAAVGVRRRLRADRVNQQCHEMAQLDGHSRK